MKARFTEHLPSRFDCVAEPGGGDPSRGACRYAILGHQLDIYKMQLIFPDSTDAAHACVSPHNHAATHEIHCDLTPRFTAGNCYTSASVRITGPRTHPPSRSSIGGVQGSATLQAIRFGGIVNRSATRGTPLRRRFGPPHRPGVGQTASRRRNAHDGHETPDRAPSVGHLRFEHADGYERQRQGHQHRDEETRSLHALIIASTGGGFEHRRRRGEV